jgi:hypothetical protein
LFWQVTPDIRFYIFIEVDGSEHFSGHYEDLCDPILVLYNILVQRHVRNPHIIFARVPSAQHTAM